MNKLTPETIAHGNFPVRELLYNKDDPFYWTVSHNPAGMPNYVYCGYWSQQWAIRNTK